MVTDKIETEKARVNLKADRARLFNEKNSLVAKKEELRAEIATLNTTELPNVPIHRHQDPLLRPIQNKLKTKRPPLFDGLKKNLQRFLIGTRYYQRFYQQSLSFDSNKVQNVIVNIIGNVSK